MNLLFDARCLAQPRTGIQVVAENMLKVLNDWLPPGALTVLAPAESAAQLEGLGRPILQCEIAPYDFFRQSFVARLINMQPQEMLVSPTYFIPFGTRKPFVSTVHDLIPRTIWLGRQSIYVRLILGQTLKRARAVLTVSEYSRQRLATTYPKLASRLHVVPSGFTAPLPDAEIKPPGQLLLFLSRYRHKNCGFAISAFDELQRLSGGAWHLHLVGDVCPRDEQHLSRLSNVTRHGRISDEALIALYRRVWGVLIPSLEEGFSLPLLEGMSHGCVVFFHRATAMSETAGEGGVGLEVKSPGDWAKAILAVAHNREHSAEQQRQATTRARGFTRERFNSALRAALEAAYAEP